MDRRVLLSLCILAVPGVSFAQATDTETTRDSLRTKALEEVVVTGQYEPQSIKNSVYRVRTIENEQLCLRASHSVENILSTQLGMRFSNDLTLGESDMQLLGMSRQIVEVLVEGLPLIDRG